MDLDFLNNDKNKRFVNLLKKYIGEGAKLYGEQAVKYMNIPLGRKIDVLKNDLDNRYAILRYDGKKYKLNIAYRNNNIYIIVNEE